MAKMFDIKVPFYKVMQKIEARKWLPAKETFDECAIDKLALMHRADLSEQDRIHLLVNGITQSLLRGTALSVNAATMMRRITQGVADQERRPATANPMTKAKDSTFRNCGKKGHSHKNCKGKISCFYRKKKGHRRFDCPLLKKKEIKKQTYPATSAVAAEITEEHLPEDVVAVVQESSHRLIINSPLVQVNPDG